MAAVGSLTSLQASRTHIKRLLVFVRARDYIDGRSHRQVQILIVQRRLWPLLSSGQLLEREALHGLRKTRVPA